MLKLLLTVIGPTAVGKTDLSIFLAQKFKTEIISADSRQMYRELNIGTAVPSEYQLNTIKHHFIHNISIHDYYNASKFEVEVLDLLEKLFKNYDIVLMVGGSGMYVDAVCNGIDDLPEIDHELRKSLLIKYEQEGIESLRRQLKILDPEYYEIVDLKNAKRILKGLEVSIMTGRPYSSFRTNTKKARNFRILKIGLERPREQLYDIINQRVDQMFDNGLFDEVKQFYEYKHLNSLNTVGYKEIYDYLDGKCTLEEAKELIKRDTRRFAKRQLSWFKRDNEINWFNPCDVEKIMEFLRIDTKITD